MHLLKWLKPKISRFVQVCRAPDTLFLGMGDGVWNAKGKFVDDYLRNMNDMGTRLCNIRDGCEEQPPDLKNAFEQLQLKAREGAYLHLSGMPPVMQARILTTIGGILFYSEKPTLVVPGKIEQVAPGLLARLDTYLALGLSEQEIADLLSDHGKERTAQALPDFDFGDGQH